MGNKDKEFVQEITNIDEDFARWYADILMLRALLL